MLEETFKISNGSGGFVPGTSIKPAISCVLFKCEAVLIHCRVAYRTMLATCRARWPSRLKPCQQHQRHLRQRLSVTCSAQQGSRAAVIGAGMAGMSCAVALSKHFDQERASCCLAQSEHGVVQETETRRKRCLYAPQVVLLERDSVGEERLSQRPGVPQYAQTHNLLVRGLQELEAQFPGYFAEVVAEGGQVVDW